MKQFKDFLNLIQEASRRDPREEIMRLRFRQKQIRKENPVPKLIFFGRIRNDPVLSRGQGWARDQNDLAFDDYLQKARARGKGLARIQRIQTRFRKLKSQSIEEENLTRQTVRDILRVRPRLTLDDIKRLSNSHPDTVKRASDEGSWIRKYINKTKRRLK